MLTSALFGDRIMGLKGPVSVPWTQRSLDAGFTAMTFVNEDTVRFRYRIAGLEERWNETRLREVHLPGLPAGSYTFEVQANAGPGAWDPVTARLAFTIQPAWWRTWWFDLSALAAAAFLAKQLWAWRLRSILRRQKELEAAVADRTAHLERQKQEIERLFLESQQAARLKEEFLANMNHELRTPMNGIIGMTELALDTALTEEQREYLETVHNSSGSLLGMIDDILDFSNIEAGKLDLQSVVFDPRDVMNRAVRNLAPRARQKNLEMLQHIDSSVPHRLVGDPFRLRQVLINLMSNAVKFTERGQVSVNLLVEEERPAGPLLHFEIADTGVGICPEKQSVIFEPFSQADGSLTRRYGGAGLGLTICARFVEMMGGEIWVESELGQGSRFHFTARFPRPPETAPAGRLPDSRRPIKLYSPSMRLFPLLLCFAWPVLAQDEPVAGRPARRRRIRRTHQRRHLFQPARAQHRPGVHLRPRGADRGVPRRFQPLPGRRGIRRHLPDLQQRHHVDTGFRQLRVLLDRRHHHRSQESVDRLGGHRRKQQPAQRLLRRRRLQERRRRPYLAQRRA